MTVRIRHRDIPKHELIGLECEITSATDPTHIGKKGIIVDETMNTLVIAERSGEKRIPKGNVILMLRINKGEVVIHGKRLIGRPEDRVKNK
jgi:ribonuclease P protein subunit POP4